MPWMKRIGRRDVQHNICLIPCTSIDCCHRKLLLELESFGHVRLEPCDHGEEVIVHELTGNAFSTDSTTLAQLYKIHHTYLSDNMKVAVTQRAVLLLLDYVLRSPCRHSRPHRQLWDISPLEIMIFMRYWKVDLPLGSVTVSAQHRYPENQHYCATFTVHPMLVEKV